jgi:hypothetical protein
LLDWLAATFMEDGWSIKKLHRRILLSNTYRQISVASTEALRVDPENRWLSRMNRRRLEFEPLRDALLAVAGRLDDRAGGPAAEWIKPPYSMRRSVYGFIDRQNLPGLLRTFDFASPDSSTSQRHATTVPQQALFLMNSPFVIEQAHALAARPDVQSQRDDNERIQRLHWLAYGRPAEPEEIALGRQFITSVQASAKSPLSPWEQYAQVLLLANEFALVD